MSKPTRTAAIVAEITEQVQSQILDWYGAGAVMHTRSPVPRRLKWSFFLDYDLVAADGSRQTALVKILRSPGLEKLEQAIAVPELVQEARCEFQSLCDIARVFSQVNSSEFCYIRPLAYWPDWNAIVMERLPNQSLKHLVLNWRFALRSMGEWNKILALMRQAGRWLCIFHEQLGDIRPQPLRDAALQAEIELGLKGLAVASGNQIDVAPWRTRLSRLCEQVRDTSVPVATLHGDFNVGNIVVTRQGCIGALDSNRQSRGPIYQDLAQVLTDLPTRKNQVLSGGRFYRSNDIGLVQQAILQGYFGGRAIDRPALNLYCALATLKKWTVDEEFISAWREPRRRLSDVVRPVVRSYFERMLSNIVQASAYGYATDL